MLGLKNFVISLLNHLLNAYVLLSLQLTHMALSTIVPPIYRFFLFFLYVDNYDLFRTPFAEQMTPLMIG